MWSTTNTIVLIKMKCDRTIQRMVQTTDSVFENHCFHRILTDTSYVVQMHYWAHYLHPFLFRKFKRKKVNKISIPNVSQILYKQKCICDINSWNISLLFGQSNIISALCFVLFSIQTLMNCDKRDCIDIQLCHIL